MASCDNVGCHFLGLTLIDHWGDFSCCFGVTLIGFLVLNNQCKTETPSKFKI